jgi:GAF domain-containing protein
MKRRSKASSKAANAGSRKAEASQRRRQPKSAPTRHSTPTAQETEVARLTRQLKDAREQQEATAEVLSVISASPDKLDQVLDTLVRSAVRFCGADDATIHRVDGQELRVAAHFGPVPHRDIGDAIRLVRGSINGRAVLERAPVHVADLQVETREFPESIKIARELGFRACLGVPLLRKGVALGTICLRRVDAKLFTNKQIDLAKNFAAQAVIAIENTRLLNELHQRTDDLTESLEQQTATSEVLRVISSSPGELQPVFNAILDNATRICEAKFGTMFLREGDVFRFAAEVGTPSALAEHNRRSKQVTPTPGGGLDEILRTKQVRHIVDAATDVVPSISAKLGGARSTVYVPMLNDDQLIGVIIIYR